MIYRTDMAMEAAKADGNMDGVRVSRRDECGIDVTTVEITTMKAASRLAKPVGKYVTLESNQLRDGDIDARASMADALSSEIRAMVGEISEDSCVLVAGLGNRMVTPDSLGPRVIENILVTRHIFENFSDEAENMRSVCAIAPGVLGVTGIETAEMLKCVAKAVKPSKIICVDALAALSSARIGTAVQVCDTGIEPGSGVGNRRSALNKESLGADVIAIGMPTVIYAATLARDAFIATRESMTDGEIEALEASFMKGEAGEMIVTPREIDALIENAADILSSAINRALQTEMSASDIDIMMK